MPRGMAVLLALVAAAAGACNEKSYVDVFVDDLRPGDCFDGSPRAPEDAGEEERTVLVVSALPCSESHEKEVFAVFEHPAAPGFAFPERDLTKLAQDGCADRFPAYVGSPFEDSELQVSVIAPGPVPWEEGDRTIVCTLQGDEPLKGSQKADGD